MGSLLPLHILPQTANWYKRLTDRNAGSPKNREVHGDGVPIVVGARESLVRGEGEQVRQWIDQLAARDAPVKRTGRPLETGKPDADESRTSRVRREARCGIPAASRRN